MWGVNHDGIRRKPIEKAIPEKAEHDRMFHAEIQKECRLNHLMNLNLIGVIKLLLHDRWVKGIRKATQPLRKTPQQVGQMEQYQYSIGVFCYANGIWPDQPHMICIVRKNLSLV
jgi:hypothetical protein